MLNHAALFAGLGGFIYASEKEALKTIWANEIDKNCCETLSLNFPQTLIIGKSITDIVKNDIPDEEIDLLTAGFPCQSFSQAGNMGGFEDPRGRLFFDIPRIVKLMKHPPKVVLLENVAFLKIYNKGEFLKTIISEMRFAGYWVKEENAQVICSSQFGATPQRRERLFIVCVHKSFKPRNSFEFNKIRESCRVNLFDFIDRSKQMDDCYYLGKDDKYSKMMSELAKEQGTDRLYQIRRTHARACAPNFCPTLTANMGEGGHNVPFVFDDFGLRRLTETECLRLQGFDPAAVRVPEALARSRILKMVGNAVSVGTVSAIINSIKTQLFNLDGVEGGTEKRMAISAE